MKNIFGLLLTLACTLSVQAAEQTHPASWFDKKIKTTRLYDKLLKSGVPEPALHRVFEFLDINDGKSFKVKADENKTVILSINNKHYAVVIDFTKPSSERRFYFMDLADGDVEKYYVAHGVNTGADEAENFSNTPDSKETSLGLYLTGSNYSGKHGNSLYLYGLEKSNNNAFDRNIVMHGAQYVSMDFLGKYGRMGRSWGCPAVSQPISQKLIPLLKNGAIFYAYHQKLMRVALASPTVQEVSTNQQPAPDNGHQVVPEESEP